MCVCRLLIDEASSGVWNMAVDEALLRSAAENGRSTLRIYAWSQPTLSLGYFQRHEDRSQHAASKTCTMVRRHSGGGAIVHDHELTYSLTLPITERWNEEAGALVEKVHTAVGQVLGHHGMNWALSDQVVDDDRFLCFQRRAVGDLVSGPHKILGSAQRRKKNALLQHGSLLISASVAAPELAGFTDLTSGSGASPLWSEVPAAILSAIGMQHEASELSGEEADWAHEYANEKFGTDAWTLRR